jgi:hypothetical protein
MASVAAWPGIRFGPQHASVTGHRIVEHGFASSVGPVRTSVEQYLSGATRRRRGGHEREREDERHTDAMR